MNKNYVSYALEVALSLLILGGLFWVAFFVKPSVDVPSVEAQAIEPRDNFFGVASPGDSGRVVWAAGSFGKIVRSEDGGKTWQIQPTPVKSHLQDIAAWDAETAFAAGDKGVLLMTRNGGDSWQLLEVDTFPMGGGQFLRAHVDAEGRGWVAGGMGTVLLSEDRGATWQQAHPRKDVSWNDIAVDSSGAVWVVGEFGEIQRSPDGGDTWESIPSPTASSLMAITFSGRGKGIAVGLSGTVIQTVDSGKHWTAVELDTSAHLFDVSWSGARYQAVGNGGVLVSGTDSGQWDIGSVADGNYGWYTNITATDGGFYIAGRGIRFLGPQGSHAFTSRTDVAQVDKRESE
ncbi:WD40/YVTN/BNR-like repeat-containing protein [Marinobacter orientalis]|uniref:Glycosyl hydrolase n=1 Tax=Marinobacter orientalis TaxID=1928859 RepID=A0A7Y0NJW6_9GAMM|nr:YCF48-related protein [Marinobacter orientalis]NMT62707.1 glycosyl hydrolase [Marinobacter orientalis]TGX51392.1 glycosyl hydrolase [Marinobacter orientalis]